MMGSAVLGTAAGAHASAAATGLDPSGRDAGAAALLAARPGPGDPPAIPWRDANQQVGRIGGWRAYAREVQQERATRPVGPPVHGSLEPSPAATGASAPFEKEPR